ncbi:MAG: glycosyltransferase [Paludibacteraceae bacterium]|nr:glycosyltransferase [Paludibacteraceae bacterium]
MSQDNANILVSVIMPTYNCAQFIARSIESVLAQTHTNWELLIVDDCSTDDTTSVVKPYRQDTRIHYSVLDHNSGAAVARNTALLQAKGQYIAFLDSDDYWSADKLTLQIEFMQAHHYAFTYTAFHRTDKPLRISGPKHITPLMMSAFCWPSCPTVMYDRQVIGLIQIPPIRKHNDYAMWLQIIQKADCYLLDQDLFAYNKHAGSISSTNYWSLIKWHYILWHQVIKKNALTSIWWTLMNIIFGIYKKLRYVQPM